MVMEFGFCWIHNLRGYTVEGLLLEFCGYMRDLVMVGVTKESMVVYLIRICGGLAEGAGCYD